MRDELLRIARAYGAGEEIVDRVLARAPNNPLAELASELSQEPDLDQLVNQAIDLLPPDEARAIRDRYYRGQLSDTELIESGLGKLRSLLAGRPYPPRHKSLMEVMNSPTI